MKPQTDVITIRRPDATVQLSPTDLADALTMGDPIIRNVAGSRLAVRGIVDEMLLAGGFDAAFLSPDDLVDALLHGDRLHSGFDGDWESALNLAQRMLSIPTDSAAAPPRSTAEQPSPVPISPSLLARMVQRAMNANCGPLEIRYYVPSPAFRAIPEHVAVTRPDGAVVALTGPSGDAPSQRLAAFYATAADDAAALGRAVESAWAAQAASIEALKAIRTAIEGLATDAGPESPLHIVLATLDSHAREEGPEPLREYLTALHRIMRQLVQLAGDAAQEGIGLFLEWRDVLNRPEDEARTEAVAEITEGARCVADVEMWKLEEHRGEPLPEWITILTTRAERAAGTPPPLWAPSVPPGNGSPSMNGFGPYPRVRIPVHLLLNLVLVASNHDRYLADLRAELTRQGWLDSSGEPTEKAHTHGITLDPVATERNHD